MGQYRGRTAAIAVIIASLAFLIAPGSPGAGASEPIAGGEPVTGQQPTAVPMEAGQYVSQFVELNADYVAPDGFALLDGGRKRLSRGDFWILLASDSFSFRPDFVNVVGAITDEIPMGLRVSGNQYPANHALSVGEIIVLRDNPVLCPGAIACATWYTIGNTIVAGEMRLGPSVDTAPATGPGGLQAIFEHELGHVFGLAHYTSSYAGQLQLMYPTTASGAAGYRPGDRNGLWASYLTDVGTTAWFAKYVRWMGTRDITNGCARGRYCPFSSLTRAEVAAFLYRMAGEPAVTGSHPYGDLLYAWQQNPVTWMHQQGITFGCASGKFCPGRRITRGELAAFMHRYSGLLAPTQAHGFADVLLAWQQDPVAWMKQFAITGGCGGANFCPQRFVTRAEAAAFLYRLADQWPWAWGDNARLGVAYPD